MKLPHHYASDYIKARGNPDAQKAVIDSAPKEWIDLIRTHVRIKKEWDKHNERKSTRNNNIKY
jgi:hypothetical protein